jgi:hypothetical protein
MKITAVRNIKALWEFGSKGAATVVNAYQRLSGFIAALRFEGLKIRLEVPRKLLALCSCNSTMIQTAPCSENLSRTEFQYWQI